MQASLIGKGETLQAPMDVKRPVETSKKSVVSVSSRATPQEMRANILRLCRGRYLTRSELSATLGRNAVFLGSTYLKPMVEEGLLELRYPDTPTHSRQAYRTITTEEDSL